MYKDTYCDEKILFGLKIKISAITEAIRASITLLNIYFTNSDMLLCCYLLLQIIIFYDKCYFYQYYC